MADKRRPEPVRRLLAELADDLSKLSPMERRRNLDEGATFVAEGRAQRSKPAASATAPGAKARGRAGR
jgi:hypothetical protein